MKATFRLLSIVTAAAMVSGCRTGEGDFPRIVNEPMPVPPAQLSGFGVIGILPADLSAQFEFGRPATPLEAGGAIGTKAFIELADTSMKSDEGHPGRQLGDIAFSAALGGVIGVFGGILAGVPEGDVRRAQEAMDLALKEIPLEKGVRMQLGRLARKKSSTNLMIIPENVVVRPNGDFSTAGDLRTLAHSGIDSVLVLRADDERFVPGEGLNPAMAVEINLSVQIVRVADGQVLFVQTLLYRGDKQPFTRWGENRAKLFRAELEVAQRTFAISILNELSN